MSDKPISAGDLVQIVKPMRCGCAYSIGLIFRVGEVNSHRGGRCYRCKQKTFADGMPAALDPADGLWTEISRLKRIPPLEELDDVKREEEITA